MALSTAPPLVALPYARSKRATRACPTEPAAFDPWYQPAPDPLQDASLARDPACGDAGLWLPRTFSRTNARMLRSHDCSPPETPSQVFDVLHSCPWSTRAAPNNIIGNCRTMTVTVLVLLSRTGVV